MHTQLSAPAYNALSACCRTKGIFMFCCRKLILRQIHLIKLHRFLSYHLLPSSTRLYRCFILSLAVKQVSFTSFIITYPASLYHFYLQSACLFFGIQHIKPPIVVSYAGWRFFNLYFAGLVLCIISAPVILLPVNIYRQLRPACSHTFLHIASPQRHQLKPSAI